MEGKNVTIGVLNEAAPEETRVALVPESVKKLVSKGTRVLIPKGAGEKAGYADEEYQEAGACLCPDPGEVLAESDVLLRVVGPQDAWNGAQEVAQMKEGVVLVGFLFPAQNPEVVKALAERRITAFALDALPRLSRAQPMDALSSMSTVAGYRAALLSAMHLPRFFPMLMTAAGTLKPARVLIIGAGVAGLQAIATCKRLGAIVDAFDVRPAVKEQVESLGAHFLAPDFSVEAEEDPSGYAKQLSEEAHQAEVQLLQKHFSKYDVVITTALVPGKPAPKLITEEMVRSLPSGAVIVDLAAPAGGNCTLTRPGETIHVGGVTLIGALDLPRTMPGASSQMYSRNITEFLLLFITREGIQINLTDEILRGCLITQGGEIVHEPTKSLLASKVQP
jgi:NAD(P) transhydrogenase subunit alpha